MKKKILIILFVILGGIFYLKILAPTFNFHIPCIFKTVTGLDCPGCGMTRASLALLDGNIYQAFRFNMLIFFLTPLLLIYLVFDQKKIFPSFNKILMGNMFLLTALFFILRNTSSFSWLAPTYIGS